MGARRPFWWRSTDLWYFFSRAAQFLLEGYHEGSLVSPELTIGGLSFRHEPQNPFYVCIANP